MIVIIYNLDETDKNSEETQDSNKKKPNVNKEKNLNLKVENQEVISSNHTNLNNTTVSNKNNLQIKICKTLEIKRVNDFCVEFQKDTGLKIQSEKIEYFENKKELNLDEQLSNSDERLNSHKIKVPKTTKNKENNLEKDVFTHLRKSSVTYKENKQDQSMTILNMVNDLSLIEKISKGVQKYKAEHNMEKLSENGGTEGEIEKGYVSEDDEDLEFEGAFFPQDMSINFQDDFSHIVDKEIRKSNISNEINVQKCSQSNQIKKISSHEELKNLLFQVEILKKPNHPNLIIETEAKIIEDEEVEIIKADLFLVVLNYLYTDLHSGLIELSDTFVEQRRLFFEKDQKAYIAIIRYFLKKKGEFFLGVLSTIMSALNISQKLIDNTLIYYNTYANQEDQKVKQIRVDYDKIYSAGIKQTIAPKNLNKNRLKEIYNFQCQKYEELLEEYKNEFPNEKDDEVDRLDIIGIIVIDYTYVEFGFDRDTIRAAENKLIVHEDPDIEVYLNKLSQYKKDNFLNI